MRRRVRSGAHRRLRHHQARQSVRRRGGRRACSTPIARRSPAIRSRPSAASSRSTGTLDAEAARAITEIFTEVIIAPDATRGGDRDRRRQEEPAPAARRRRARSARAGHDRRSRSPAGCWCSRATTPWSTTMELKTVTKRAPTAAELADLRFAFRVAKHVKSNTIVYAKDGATVGIGAGQMSRVDAARIAARKAAGRRAGGGARGAARPGLGGRVRRVLPVRRRAAGRDRGRRHRGDPARRLDARRRGDRRPPTSTASPWCSPASAISGIRVRSADRRLFASSPASGRGDENRLHCWRTSPKGAVSQGRRVTVPGAAQSAMIAPAITTIA